MHAAAVGALVRLRRSSWHECTKAAENLEQRRGSMRNPAMCVFLLSLILVDLGPATAYNPFGTGAPPTLEMVRAACEGEVASCELDCSRDVADVEPRLESASVEEEQTEERPLTDLELDHLIELNRPAAQVKVALRKVSLTKSQIEQLIALEERTPGVWGNRLVVKKMLRGKTPSDKYERKQYCCGEMLRAVLNGNQLSQHASEALEAVSVGVCLPRT